MLKPKTYDAEPNHFAIQAMTVVTPTSEISRRVNVTVNRLRTVEIDFANQPESLRAAYLTEELRRGLASVPAQQRDAFVQEVAQKFPSWNGSLMPANGEDAQGAEAAATATRLMELFPTLAPETRATLSQKINAATDGAAAAAWSPQFASQVMKRLSINNLVPDRALEAIELLHDLLQHTDRLVWHNWTEMAPQSQFRPPRRRLRNLIGPFLAGDPSVSYAQMKDEAAMLRQLMAAMIATTAGLARQLASEQFGRPVTSEIEELVRAEGKKVFTKARCWEKYSEMAASFDAASMETEIRKKIVNATEELLKEKSAGSSPAAA